MIKNLIDYQVILILVLIFVPLERLLPNRPSQLILRRHWFNDCVYLFFNGFLIKFGYAAVAGLALVGARAVLPASLTTTVASQPFWLQVIGAIIVADAGFYGMHRLFHAVPALWRFHSVHHSIEELDWLAAHRVHPADQILVSAASLVPVFALGFSNSAITVMAVTYLLQSHLIHANTRLPFGPLRWVFASPLYHHWHHANQGQPQSNFSAQLTYMDWIFGTLHMPDKMPEKLGIDDPVPTDYLRQLAYPLFWQKPAAAPLSEAAE